MKKNLLLILLSFSIFATASAQMLNAEEETAHVNVIMDGGNYFELIYFTNSSSTNMEVEWERISNDLPAGWLSFVCIDGGSCYPPSTNGSTANENWVIPAGESRWLEVQMRATEAEGAVPGTGTVVLEMRDKNNPNNADQATWVGTAFSTPTDDIEVDDVKVYPNPASDFIKISNAGGIETIEIYNLIGKKVKNFTGISDDDTYDISGLPTGMYLIRMLDEDGELLITKRISKK